MERITPKFQCQKQLAVLLAFSILLMSGCFALTVDAATVQQTDSGVAVTLSDENLQLQTSGGSTQYSTDAGSSWTDYSGSITITGTGSVKVLTGTHNVILEDATLTNSSGSAFDIQSGAAVNLTLLGENSCTASASAYAGLHVPTGATLTITEESTGSLTAQGGSSGAGIGGKSSEASGKIIINGGSITAVGTFTGAGIGGGSGGASDVTINGGTIVATGAHGAAIGSGDMCRAEKAGTVVINGGTVTATSTSAAAAIGGGGSSQGNVTITGGIVTAINTHTNDYTGGAAIGGGDSTNGIGYVTITGGTVIAEAYKGDGIGGSSISSGSTVEITGGNIKSTSEQGEGISGLSDIGMELTEITLGTTGDNTQVTSIVVNGTTYGVDDVYLIDGKLYVYLPSDAVIEELEVNGVTYSINSQQINYSVDPTYTVTIPETVKLGESVTIKADDVVLKKGSQLNVALTGTSGENNAFTLKSEEGATIAYTVKKGTSNVEINNTILTVSPEEKKGETELSFVAPASIQFSGKYTGTVTFTISTK